jgi:hypothetical protein
MSAMETRCSKDTVFYALKELLKNMLGNKVEGLPPTIRVTPDGAVHKKLGNCLVPLVSIEHKQGFDEDYDPFVQGAFYVEEFDVSDEV